MIRKDINQIRDNMILKACPFCGHDLNNQDPMDTLYPANRWWNPETEEMEYSWHIVCQENAGGCSCEVYGRDPSDCIEKWNQRTHDND